MVNSKDLFDNTTMSFGEHLEVLRIHLWKALIGLFLCVLVTLFFGDQVIRILREPIDKALLKYGYGESGDGDVTDDLEGFSFFSSVKHYFTSSPPKEVVSQEEVRAADPGAPPADTRTIRAKIDTRDLLLALHQADPDVFQSPSEELPPKSVVISLTAPEFGQFRNVVSEMHKPITLQVQEAFTSYLKIAVLSGFVLASPWVFYQLWLFVASGLYPHERKYIYTYLPMSLVLFLGGAVFCYYVVFPFVLDFLLGFNEWINVHPQIRLSEWLSFAIMLPLMFGVSFQLPLVMLFLERISIFSATDYRQKRRMAILVIAFLSMLLTPPDPMSMLSMMFPMILLYELGILLCEFSPSKSQVDVEPA